MSLARYFLIEQNGVWLVTLEGRVMARCTSRTEAIETAATMADLMGSMHYDADVAAETGDGSGIEVVWRFGDDPVPLRGPRQDEATAVHPHVRLVQRGGAPTDGP